MPCTAPPLTRARSEGSESECRDEEISKKRKKKCRDGTYDRPASEQSHRVAHLSSSFMTCLRSTGTFFIVIGRRRGQMPRNHYVEAEMQPCPGPWYGTSLWTAEVLQWYHGFRPPSRSTLRAALRRHRVHAEPGTDPLPLHS